MNVTSIVRPGDGTMLKSMIARLVTSLSKRRVAVAIYLVMVLLGLSIISDGWLAYKTCSIILRFIICLRGLHVWANLCPTMACIMACVQL